MKNNRKWIAGVIALALVFGSALFTAAPVFAQGADDAGSPPGGSGMMGRPSQGSMGSGMMGRPSQGSMGSGMMGRPSQGSMGSGMMGGANH